MKKHSKIVLKRETIRSLTVPQLGVAHGGQINNSGTGCVCYPSDGIAQHCDTYTCSGQTSCDPATCTISLSG